VNSDTNTLSMQGFTTTTPSVGLTTKAMCIAAKGLLNSTNNPAAVPDTWPETTVYTVVSAPVMPSPPAITVFKQGANVVLSWTWANPPGWLGLQTTPTLQSPSWSYVTNIVQMGNTYYSTNAIGPGNAFYRLQN